jgi:hypothetical protein
MTIKSLDTGRHSGVPNRNSLVSGTSDAVVGERLPDRGVDSFDVAAESLSTFSCFDVPNSRAVIKGTRQEKFASFLEIDAPDTVSMSLESVLARVRSEIPEFDSHVATGSRSNGTFGMNRDSGNPGLMLTFAFKKEFTTRKREETPSAIVGTRSSSGFLGVKSDARNRHGMALDGVAARPRSVVGRRSQVAAALSCVGVEERIDSVVSRPRRSDDSRDSGALDIDTSTASLEERAILVVIGR